MRAARCCVSSSSGFSLIEVIMAIVLAGVLGAMLVSFHSPLARLPDPLGSTDDLLRVNQVMAAMVADYEARGIARGEAGALTSFMSGIGTAAGLTMNNKYGSYVVVAYEVLDDDAANGPRLLTIAVNGRSVTHLFTRRPE